ncbi:MAG: archaemetzincin family Zn-dependent metalloprotease [Nitrospiraceae bacterium]|nr:archaemetzincin family Zn-dependent metalloprotease [Nitrospiraceae bacterium]
MGEQIKIVPLGEVDGGIMMEVATQVSMVFGITATVNEMQRYHESAYNHQRGQYSAESFLKFLDAPKEGSIRVLGITDVDLYIPDLNYVFGLADESRDVSLISISRFKKGNGKVVERAVKTAVHELGHTYGLVHCHDNKCVMYFSYNLSDTDYKGKEFCIKCQETLDKSKNLFRGETMFPALR